MWMPLGLRLWSVHPSAQRTSLPFRRIVAAGTRGKSAENALAWNIAHGCGVEWGGGHAVQGEIRPPVFAVWLLRAAERLAPGSARKEWSALWNSRLVNLWVLAERGELPVHAPSATIRLCCDAVAGAFWLRF